MMMMDVFFNFYLICWNIRAAVITQGKQVVKYFVMKYNKLDIFILETHYGRNKVCSLGYSSLTLSMAQVYLGVFGL